MDKNKSKDESKILIKLRLYVVYSSKSSYKATVDLKKFLDSQFKNQYKLEIVDVLQQPKVAEKDKIIATPTLVKSFPEPIKKVIGDFSNGEKVSLGLDLKY